MDEVTGGRAGALPGHHGRTRRRRDRRGGRSRRRELEGRRERQVRGQEVGQQGGLLGRGRRVGIGVVEAEGVQVPVVQQLGQPERRRRVGQVGVHVADLAGRGPAGQVRVVLLERGQQRDVVRVPEL